MATLTSSNHYKSQKHKGEVRLKAQAHNVSLTFANTPGKITFPANVSTYGLEIGDRIMTNSANAANAGPFYIKSISTVDATVMNADGSDPTLTAGTEAGLTCGTYLVRCMLMRNGFTFNAGDHAALKNIKGTMTASTIAFVDGGGGNDSITDSGNGFISAGFVAGNSITISGTVSNNITVIVLTVSAGTIEVATGSFTAEAAGASVTLTANDELATANGYTQSSKLTGAISVSEDDTYNLSDATFPTIQWTASVGNIGPTPGCLFYELISDTIMSFLDAGGNQTATAGSNLYIGGGTFRIE